MTRDCYILENILSKKYIEVYISVKRLLVRYRRSFVRPEICVYCQIKPVIKSIPLGEVTVHKLFQQCHNLYWGACAKSGKWTVMYLCFRGVDFDFRWFLYPNLVWFRQRDIFPYTYFFYFFLWLRNKNNWRQLLIIIQWWCFELPNALYLESSNKGNNKITELRTILQRESQNS